MLKIIAGQFRGRPLEQPPASLTRPTAARTREAVFSIVMHHLEKARVLDVFAGSGAYGLEALSRGAAHVTFVEAHRQVLRVLQQNIQKLGVSAQTTVLPVDIQKLPLAPAPVDLVFLDPPYGEKLEITALEQLLQKNWLTPETLVVLEVASRQELDFPNMFELKDARTYGAAKVVFLTLKEITEL